MISRLKAHRLWALALVVILFFSSYWGFIAADRYVSVSHIVVENLQPARAAQIDIPAMLTGSANGGSKELLLLRDYLLSTDMLLHLDAKLGLRAHYSDSYDVLSRMWSKDLPLEWFLRHYQGRVEVQHDEFAGLLMIRAQAYSPEMAHAIASAMVEEGERFMNELARQIARDQVAFAEREVAKVAERVTATRSSLVKFQNEHGLVSPRGTVESMSATVARLEAELTTLQTRRRMLESYLSPGAPDLVQANGQVQALEQQLVSERTRLASPRGKSLNIVAEQYDRLQLEAEFAHDVYRTALVALEQSRVEATRTLKKVSVLQSPTKPEYPLEPRRLYNTAVYLLGTLLLMGILSLILTIIREHQD